MEILKTGAQIDSVSQSQKASFDKVQNNSSEIKKSEDQNNNVLTEKLADIAKKLNEQMDSLGTNIRFAYNDEFGSMYIKVTEKDTGNIIRQIPTEEAMRLTQYFKDAIGMIFDKES